MPPTQSPLRLDAEILSRMRSEVTSRSNWANDSSTFRVATPIDRADADSPGPSPKDGRPAAGTPGCETGDDEQGERALAGRMRYANGCEADQRRDHAGAQSRRRVCRGPAAPDQSSPAAWLSGRPALGLAKGRLAAISARDLVDPVAVHLLRAELELEGLAPHAGAKARDT